MGTSPNMMNGDTMGLPPAIARRKNGLMQALMAIPEDDQGMGMGASQPSASPMGDAAPPPQAQPQSQPRQDRFMDDQPTRSQQPQSLAEKMNAGDYSDMQVGQPQQQNDHMSQLQGEYDKLGQPRPPMKLWQKIALGASAPFGGLQGFVQERNQQNERTDKQRGGLLQQIEAERRMQEQEQLGTQRMTLQEQMQGEREKAAQASQERVFGQQNQMEDRREKSRAELDAATRGASDDRLNRTLQATSDRQDKTFAEQEKLTRIREQNKREDISLKPTVDEQRRADLSRNMNENLDKLEDIAKRRPELFGPLAGRWTSLKNKIGTGDPDVAALETIKEQMGMAMVGAHAMRNAAHVAEAANSILNNFNNKPEAMAGSIQMARSSLATFQQDAGQPLGSAPKVQMGRQPAKATGPKLKDRVSGRVLVEGKDF